VAADKHETALVILLGFGVLMVLGMVTVHGQLSLNSGGGLGNTPADVGKDTSLLPGGGGDCPGPRHLPLRQQTNPGLGALRINHSLYRQPATCGAERAIVVGNGWDWFANPPEAEGIY
jgi:hypothetical protein